MTWIFLADGFEEVEAVSLFDVLRRGGEEVRFVGVGGDSCEKTGAHGLVVKTCMSVESKEALDEFAGVGCVVLPGGLPGATNLAQSEKVLSFLRRAKSEKKLICAICAAPFVLGEAGVLAGKFTCYPGFEARALAGVGAGVAGAAGVATYTGTDVEVSEWQVTANGPASALKFAFAILEALKGKEAGERVKKEMLLV